MVYTRQEENPGVSLLSCSLPSKVPDLSFPPFWYILVFVLYMKFRIVDGVSRENREKYIYWLEVEVVIWTESPGPSHLSVSMETPEETEKVKLGCSRGDF